MNSTAPPALVLPNPETPLAWLPANIAGQLQASDYLYVATLGAWGWDILMCAGQEYRILFKFRFSLPQFVYLVARVFSALYLALCTVFQIGYVDNCNHLLIVVGVIGAIAVPANSFLMYLRVRAVYNHSMVIKTIFGICWLGVLGGSLTAPFSLKGAHIGTTKRCIDSSIKAYGAAGLLAAAINDTLIFLAITYHLLTSHLTTDAWSDRLRSFVRGEGLHRMPKLLLQTGQLYYMATAGMNIFTVITVMSSGFPPLLRAMFTVPNVALTNAMACRVFRQLKLGLLVENHISGVSGLSQKSLPIQLLPPSQFSRGTTRADSSAGHSDKTHVAVEIRTDMETETYREQDSQWKTKGIVSSNV
ncbi:hypothetical protein NM688_g4405 [Phlebia brevispora]|uniref:Uncharacterized protein n=1 Tax=Phlebia brevispora TaxID=194682 RepID=A0ACC1T325_9APHY|nr:hypothetical protein NM688_g4405 [Phlebia brevispora]